MNQINLQNTKKYLFIVAGIIAIFLLITLIAIFQKPQNNEKTKVTTITTQTFIEKLPYTSKEFGIVYNQKKQIFYVNIFKEPHEQNRQKALEWIKSQGIDPASLEIFYTPSSKFKELNN